MVATKKQKSVQWTTVHSKYTHCLHIVREINSFLPVKFLLLFYFSFSFKFCHWSIANVELSNGDVTWVWAGPWAVVDPGEAGVKEAEWSPAWAVPSPCPWPCDCPSSASTSFDGFETRPSPAEAAATTSPWTEYTIHRTYVGLYTAVFARRIRRVRSPSGTAASLSRGQFQVAQTATKRTWRFDVAVALWSREIATFISIPLSVGMGTLPVTQVNSAWPSLRGWA